MKPYQIEPGKKYLLKVPGAKTKVIAKVVSRGEKTIIVHSLNSGRDVELPIRDFLKWVEGEAS